MREKKKGMMTMNQKLEELIATAHLNDLIRQKRMRKRKRIQLSGYLLLLVPLLLLPALLTQL